MKFYEKYKYTSEIQLVSKVSDHDINQKDKSVGEKNLQRVGNELNFNNWNNKFRKTSWS